MSVVKVSKAFRTNSFAHQMRARPGEIGRSVHGFFLLVLWNFSLLNLGEGFFGGGGAVISSNFALTNALNTLVRFWRCQNPGKQSISPTAAPARQAVPAFAS